MVQFIKSYFQLETNLPSYYSGSGGRYMNLRGKKGGKKGGGGIVQFPISPFVKGFDSTPGLSTRSTLGKYTYNPMFSCLSCIRYIQGPESVNGPHRWVMLQSPVFYNLGVHLLESVWVGLKRGPPVSHVNFKK